MSGFRMYKLAAQGYCCSQILILIDLEARDLQNTELVKSMAGLCGGIGGSGKTCGIVTAGACLLGIYGGKGMAEENNNSNLSKMILEYIEWFESENRSVDCCDIVGVDILEDIRKEGIYPVKCGNIMSKSYKKLKEILEKYEFSRGE